MPDWINRKTLGITGTVLGLVALIFVFRAHAANARMEKVRLLADQVRELPPDQGKELRATLRTEMGKLTPDQRRNVFEQGFETSLKNYFKLSKQDRLAYLDKMIKRPGGRPPGGNRPPGGANRPGGNGGATAKNANANNAAGNAQAKGQQQQRTPEQRAQSRRERLDQSSPQSRAMRTEFSRAMRERRAQLGLASGGGRGR